jgi:N-acyl-D-amino-acid deacylase
MRKGSEKPHQDILLKGGLIVDGTGGKAFHGNLLIRGGKIHRISPRPVRTVGTVIDCSGKVVAPGFIDSCSHMDCCLPLKGREELKWPFMAQGVTTFVGGACGVSAAGFREATRHARIIERAFACPAFRIDGETVRDYFAHLSAMGTSHNLALLAGHGSARISIRGLDPSPLHHYESSELLRLLESAMDQGALGVSLGLQREPGIFAPPEELREAALAVKRKGKVLSAHPRALSAASGAYPVSRFSAPHNLTALREILDLARRTGVRLQIPRLLFAGRRTWRTADAAFRLIDDALGAGVDVGFGVLPFPRGAFNVHALLSSRFLARLPDSYDDPAALRRLRSQTALAMRRQGMDAADVQVTDAGDPELRKYDGMLLSEIARLRRVKPEEALIEIAEKSDGRARLLCRRCATDDITEALIRHGASLFASGARVEESVAQNPAAYGAFPRFLSIVREKRFLSMEEAVRKMTGAVAERFGIADRGILAEGKAADVTVFDWETVGEDRAEESPGAPPAGIEYVFVNGKKILSGGKKESPLNAGVPLPG